MIAKQDIDNVKSIIKKVGQSAVETEKVRFDQLFQELEAAGNEYLKEVSHNVRLS